MERDHLRLLSWVIGYGYALIIGHFVISTTAVYLSDSIGDSQKGAAGTKTALPPVWQPKVLGLLERALYTASFQFGVAEIVGAWLVLKVASQWKRWSVDDEKGRARYVNFLIGNGLSILYAGVGFKLIIWTQSEDVLPILSVAIAVLLLTYILFCQINTKSKIRLSLSCKDGVRSFRKANAK